MRHSALVVIALGLTSCSSESGDTRATGGGAGTGASGGSGGSGGGGAGGSGGSSGSGGAAASGGSAGSGGGAPCVKLPSALTSGSKEICNGKDDDSNGATDDQQTGWPGFCDRSALVDPGSYTFLRTLAQYKTEFDQRWASAKAGELASATTCNPCDQGPYYLQGPLKALVTMYRATDAAAYLDDAVAIADAMIAASDPYDPVGAKPADAACFDAWAKTVPGGLHYWSTLGCTPTDASWRYQLNELQGLRGIAELAAVLSAKSDPREKKLFDYADQVISFYAMLGATKDSQGKCQGNPQLDGAADKRSHFIISAIDLHRASGDSRFLDWATKVANTQMSTVIVDDGDFVKLYVTPGATEVNDASHANREAELIRTLFEAKFPDSEKRVRQFVNTLLFRIWENDPTALLGGKVEYPFLFRNFTDGSNGCFSATSPPYRTGSVTMGWDELGRYDARVLHLMEKLTIGMIENDVPTTLPAASGCSANGNTNYSYILAAIAEMAYAQRRVTDQCGG